MVKQYRINAIVEAIKYNGLNKKEIENFIGNDSSFYELRGTDDWIVKTIYGDIVRIPNEIFRSLYTEVNE